MYMSKMIAKSQMRNHGEDSAHRFKYVIVSYSTKLIKPYLGYLEKYSAYLHYVSDICDLEMLCKL